MKLVVMRVALEVVDRLLPVCCEDILVLSIETLVNVCPWPRVELRRRVPLGGQLVVCELVLVVGPAQHDQSCRWVRLGGDKPLRSRLICVAPSASSWLVA